MIVLTVEGMSCDHCKKAVANAVAGVDPKAEYSIDLESGRVEVSSELPAKSFADAIEEAGYDIAGTQAA
ncbi:copper chaperone [Breoghania corrubedonensis]|uniref:Copper chaperone n=1 Tax=Breoghania corrubedonensis TaxID=665038 RepID=A0A2T5VEY5_9HYPH|nr:cation transporter [Breoghania corrubedonensis]PTW62308.1 copper chaperone [Breoghania corrubedonensis]